MSRFAKRLRQYERHILLGLVIMLLVSFSVVGAVQCTGQTGTVRDLSGSFQVTPTKKATVSSNELVGVARRYDPYRWQTGAPSLRYQGYFMGMGGSALRPVAAAWAHVMATEAAHRAGYRCGESYQLRLGLRGAISPRMQGLNFNDALYEKFLREYYRGTAADFQKTVAEVVAKDQFLRPLIDTQRYSVTYEEAYEAWKNLSEHVDLEYVALRGRDFELEARQIENTRTVIQEQQEALRKLDLTARSLERVEGILEARGREKVAAGEASSPSELYADLLEAQDGQAPQDGWGQPLASSLEDDAFRLFSVGPDGRAGTADDVTRETARELRSLVALERVGAALESWHGATGDWPADLSKLLGAPREGTIAPLAREEKDGWDQPLAWQLAQEGVGPALASAGPDGEAGTADDLQAVIQDGAVAVVPGPRTRGVIDDSLRDAWGNPLRVQLGDATTRRWDVRSPGPDAAFDTEDDLHRGNATDLATFYERPGVRSDYLLPPRRRFRAIYAHLPLVPDEVMTRLWNDLPEFRPDETETYDRWRRLTDPYYEAEDPRDPETGHGAALAARLASGKAVTLVPDRAIFGDAPEDLLEAEDPDRQPYLEGGWREILLREEFFERLLNDLLVQARESQQAHERWQDAKAAFEKEEGEDPGPEPTQVNFEGLLAGVLAPYLPGEADAPYLGFVETPEPLTRAEWEADDHLGDINLTIAGLQSLSEPGQFGIIPTILHDGHTKAILQNVEYVAQRQPDFDEVRDQVFERYLAKRALDLAAEELETLKRDVEKHQRSATTESEGAESSEASPDGWSRALDAWAEGVDAPHAVGRTGWFLGPRPPRSEAAAEGLAADAAFAVKQRDYVRQTGYETVRTTGEVSAQGTQTGALAREILRDEATDGTGSVYLVRVRDRKDPPPEAFSPRDYRRYLYFELLGDLLSRQPRRGSGDQAPRGRIPVALHRYYEDLPALMQMFDLKTAANLLDDPR